MSKTKRIITLTLTIVLSIFTCINISANNIENNIITINIAKIFFKYLLAMLYDKLIDKNKFKTSKKYTPNIGYILYPIAYHQYTIGPL